MESLLLSTNPITLESVRKNLFGIQKPTTINGIELVPNGLFAVDPNRCVISRDITGGEYGDSVILRSAGEEYPLFYGASSMDYNPDWITYGKKVDGDLILLQEIFSSQSIHGKNPELIKCLFFRIDESLVFGTAARLRINGKLLFDPYTKSGTGHSTIRKVIGVKDMMAIDECLECCEKVLRLEN